MAASGYAQAGGLGGLSPQRKRQLLDVLSSRLGRTHSMALGRRFGFAPPPAYESPTRTGLLMSAMGKVPAAGGGYMYPPAGGGAPGALPNGGFPPGTSNDPATWPTPVTPNVVGATPSGVVGPMGGAVTPPAASLPLGPNPSLTSSQMQQLGIYTNGPASSTPTYPRPVRVPGAVWNGYVWVDPLGGGVYPPGSGV